MLARVPGPVFCLEIISPTSVFTRTLSSRFVLIHSPRLGPSGLSLESPCKTVTARDSGKVADRNKEDDMLCYKNLLTTLSYLMLACLSVSQASCLTITDRILPGPSVIRETGLPSEAAPRAELLLHPDGQGWTVSLTQPLLRHVEIVRSEKKEQHFYYPNPLAIPAGLFACPSSAWGWFWNAVATIPDPKRQLEQRQAMADFTFTSCLMALSIVRTDRRMTEVETVVEHKLEPDSRPLTEGRVTLSWEGTHEVIVPYAATGNGRTIVRLSHLATAVRQHGDSLEAIPHGRTELVVWHRDQVLQRWPVTVTAAQLEATVRTEVPIMAPRNRWPRSLAFKLTSEFLPTDLPDPFNTVQALLVQQGLTVVASELQQTLIRQALTQNLSGLVEDDPAVGPGHWRAATVLVLITGSQGIDRSGVSLSCLNIQTRELLARIDVTAGPEGLSGALDVLTARFQDVLRQLPASTTPSGR